MGIVRMGPPEDLVLRLKQALGVSVFVETGTFRGGTATWASNHFERVITIENSKTYFEQTSKEHKHIKNIEFLYGDSRATLQAVLPHIHEPAIFWLDAHWCSMESYGSDDQCPIVDEINLIRSTGIEHHIFIDDARLFLSPPPLPNKIEQWPTIDQICTSIQSGNGPYYIVVFEDVILAVPKHVRFVIAEYCQAANTRSWNELRKPAAGKRLYMFGQRVRTIARDAWLKRKANGPSLQ